MEEVLTISQMLADMGYGHRPSAYYGWHEVFHEATGKLVGHFEPRDAILGAAKHAVSLALGEDA